MGDAVEKAIDKKMKMLVTILKRAEVPDTFVDWCKEKKIYTALDITLLAGTDSLIQSKILDPCKDKVKDVAQPDIEIAIRKAVMYCRQAQNQKEVLEKKELDPNDCQDLETAWSSRGLPPLSTRERVGKHLARSTDSVFSFKFHCLLVDSISHVS